MDISKFKEDLKFLSNRVSTLKESIGTEEATKTSLIMPFFQLLGYDVFNPTEFVPEFTADVGIKKGEKVDYAIILDSIPVMLVEAKSINEKLTKHDSQLFRYFGTTTSRFGILTNGEEYKFFTDLDEPNKMDSTPFLTINLTNLKENQIPEIAKFHKENFDIDTITSSASELKYLNNLKSFLSEQLESPSDEFVKYFVSEIFEGLKTKTTLDRFSPIIKKGLNQFITEKVNEKLSAALNTSVSVKDVPEIKEDIPTVENDGIVTTAEELEAYTIVKLMLKDTLPLERITYRDNRSYFNILLDDNIRKWIVRIYVYTSTTRIKIVLNDADKSSYDIAGPIEISSYANELVSIVNDFINKKG
ncbi:MAG: type I restriction endonuclease [Bacilli bacterium]|uniref:type I restriction endonuclease n=2 Tax=Carnobacteriaceae TaxID=186828 RepID=UPI00191B9C87|nr:type I restriction endonuclease [Carnobacterium maltaromaticum]CAD5898835.1 conserved hypothetical protein [Carnobacterium maltaromaticum]